MKIEVIDIEKLNPAKYNPRKNLSPKDKEFQKLKNSFDEFGYVEPIIWNKSTGHIVGGHQRFKILKAQGLKQIQCVVVDFPEDKEKALNIALNKISGDWDFEKLADLFENLKNLNVDLNLTGFEAPEISQITSNIFQKNIKEDNFNVDEELKKPVFSREGDLYLLGRHRLLCGDSTKKENYERLMDGQKANLILTDPPYNVNIEEKAGKIQNDNLSSEDFYNFLKSAFSCMQENLAEDGSFYVFYADRESVNFRTALQNSGFFIMQCCIWVKNQLVMGRSPYQWKHEPVLFGKKLKGKHCWYSDRKQTTIWEYDKPQRSELHPTMKPVQLMAYPIRNSTMTNGIVLDPFSGSGSTLIACEETDRICRGIELEPKFVDVIVKRYSEFTADNNIYLIRDGQKSALKDILL